MSKDLKSKQRLGRGGGSSKRRIIIWTTVGLLCAGGMFAAWHYSGTTEVEVPVARVRRGDFVISVRTRGEIKSTRSIILTAPQVPSPRIVKLSESGRPVHKGEVVVEFDPVQQEQNYIEKDTSVRTAASQIEDTKAAQKIDREADAMNQMSSEYNVERSKLEASKAEILSEIDGAKNRIDVTVAEGALNQIKTTIKSRAVSQEADLERLNQMKDKTVRDTEQAKQYLSMMVIRAPIDGIVNILPNFRSGGSYGQAPPPFKEGDQAWTGAAIAEIPDLSEMRIELKMEEVDRGKLKLGQHLKIRVDAIPEKEFLATLDWISPIAQLIYKGGGTSEKNFPARATLQNLDSRLRPGMSATAEIIIERAPSVLLIPVRASFTQNGKPAVFVEKGQQFETRLITVGRRNEEDIIVTGGLKEGERVTLENPADAARRAKKKL
jgi:RND family efflux transporter MFP subunit